MATELDPLALEAIVRARRVKRRADLRERAKGRWTWRSAVGVICIAAGWLLWSRWLEARHDLGLFPFTILLAIAASLSEVRTSKRLDAILELLDDREADQSNEAA
jgi:hypothetical protein